MKIEEKTNIGCKKNRRRRRRYGNLRGGSYFITTGAGPAEKTASYLASDMKLLYTVMRNIVRKVMF